MKLSKPEIIASAVAVAGVVLGGIGFAVHSASVKNQICVSYERQIESELDGATKLINRLLFIQQAVNENPFVAFGVLGEVNELSSKAMAFQEKSNDLRYAYEGSCDAERVRKFVDSPEIKTKLDYLIETSGQLGG